MKKVIQNLFLVLAFFFVTNANAQWGAVDHASPSNQPSTIVSPSGGGGNGTFSENFNMTACGLNYTKGSVRIETRYNAQTSDQSLWGFGFGAGTQSALTINGAFGGCNSIVQAYMYWTESALSTTVSNYAAQGSQIMTFTDPLSNNHNVPGFLIGTGPAKCWGELQTMVFRADVTPFITGNGMYTMQSITGASDPNWEVDGVTILVIYQDGSANYEGTLVIDDGNISLDGGNSPWTVTNFNVCGTASNGRGFEIVADFQSDAGPDFFTINGTTYNSPLLFWEMDDTTTTYTTGQTSSAFGANAGGDCYTFAAAGVYYQTACLGCTPNALQVLLASVNTSCDQSNLGTASITIASGTAPFTEDWSNLATNVTSVSGLQPGNYSVTVTDANGCST